jgi:DNA repair protein RadA/Sms
MSDPATNSARRFVCRACSYVHAAWAPRCKSCLSLAGLEMTDGSAHVPSLQTPAPAAATPLVVDPVPVCSLEESPSEPTRPRLVVARALDPDLEDPAEELADVTSAAPIPISEVVHVAHDRDATDLAPLDAVLGGGIVPGSAIVIGGEPGCGKSSLVMQAVAGLRLRCLYATGEETIEQAAGNARRINAASSKIFIVAETDLAVVLAHARSIRAQVVVIDSIQTLVCADLGGDAGAPGQVRGCTSRLVRFAKTTDTSVILIGHVTNDGGLAGPKTLKHLVDVVLELESGAALDGNERILRCVGKNRFGPSNVVGRFAQTSMGLVPIDGDDWNEEL